MRAAVRADFRGPFECSDSDRNGPAGAAEFQPLHIRIGICQDSQPGGRNSKLAHLELKARPIDA